MPSVKEGDKQKSVTGEGAVQEHLVSRRRGRFVKGGGTERLITR